MRSDPQLETSCPAKNGMPFSRRPVGQWRTLFALGAVARVRRGLAAQYLFSTRRRVGFSTSGNSLSLIAAFSEAKARTVTTILLGGRDGGPARGPGDYERMVRSHCTARIREGQTWVVHAWLDLVDRGFHPAATAPVGAMPPRGKVFP